MLTIFFSMHLVAFCISSFEKSSVYFPHVLMDYYCLFNALSCLNIVDINHSPGRWIAGEGFLLAVSSLCWPFSAMQKCLSLMQLHSSVLVIISRSSRSYSEGPCLCSDIGVFLCFFLAASRLGVLCLRPLIQFEFVSIQTRGRELISESDMCISSAPSTTCLRACVSFKVYFGLLCWESAGCGRMCLFLGSPCISVGLCVTNICRIRLKNKK